MGPKTNPALLQQRKSLTPIAVRNKETKNRVFKIPTFIHTDNSE